MVALTGRTSCSTRRAGGGSSCRTRWPSRACRLAWSRCPSRPWRRRRAALLSRASTLRFSLRRAYKLVLRARPAVDPAPLAAPIVGAVPERAAAPAPPRLEPAPGWRRGRRGRSLECLAAWRRGGGVLPGIGTPAEAADKAIKLARRLLVGAISTASRRRSPCPRRSPRGGPLQMGSDDDQRQQQQASADKRR